MAEEQIVQYIEELLKASPDRNFRESVDLAFNLKNLDMSQPKNRVDEEIILPHGLGKDMKIGVFAKGEVGLQAKSAGAQYVFSDEDIEALTEDKARAKTIADECDFFIAETQYMPVIGKSLGIVLGPRGKMPMPLMPGKNIVDLINSKQSAIRIRSKDRLTFHVSVGKKDMDVVKLAENIETVLSRVERALDKGKHNIKSVYITTTMGKSVRVE